MRAPKSTFANARSLRRRMTLPEVLLWQAIRRGQVGDLHFRRQHPIGSYVLDFYCATARLAVEVDGAVHDLETQVEHDKARDAWLLKQGITVLRFNASDVLHETRRQDLIATIAAAATPRTAFGNPPPPLSG